MTDFVRSARNTSKHTGDKDYNMNLIKALSIVLGMSLAVPAQASVVSVSGSYIYVPPGEQILVFSTAAPGGLLTITGVTIDLGSGLQYDLEAGARRLRSILSELHQFRSNRRQRGYRAREWIARTGSILVYELRCRRGLHVIRGPGYADGRRRVACRICGWRSGGFHDHLRRRARLRNHRSELGYGLRECFHCM